MTSLAIINLTPPLSCLFNDTLFCLLQGCFCGEIPYMFGGVFFADGRVLEETFEEYVQMVTIAIFVLFAVLLPLSYIFFTTHAINRKIRYLGKERPELTWQMVKEKCKRLCARKEKGRDVGLLDDQECYFHHRWEDMQGYLGFKGIEYFVKLSATCSADMARTTHVVSVIESSFIPPSKL